MVSDMTHCFCFGYGNNFSVRVRTSVNAESVLVTSRIDKSEIKIETDVA